MKVSTLASPVLLFAVTISLFTQLRVSFFGIGEVLLLLVFLSTLGRPVKRIHLRKFVFTQFWLVYICIAMVGTVANYYILEDGTGTIEQMFFDLAAYTFVLITCFTFERLYFEQLLDIRKFLVSLFFLSSGALAALYAVSFSTPSLFGFTLKDYDHFAPLVVNVHQASMYMVALPFLGVLVFNSSPGMLKRGLAATLIVAAVAMSIGAATTKADMAIVFGSIVLVYAYSIRGVGRRYRIVANVIYLGVAFGFLSWLDASGIFSDFFTEADPHGAREHLYSSSLAVISDSLIVGHGPGPHVLHSGSFWDVHQTHLAILLQTGALGLLLYLLFTVRIISRIWTNPALVAAFAAISVYSAGGDILRRLPIWVLLLLIYYWQVPRAGKIRSGIAPDLGRFE